MNNVHDMIVIGVIIHIVSEKALKLMGQGYYDNHKLIPNVLKKNKHREIATSFQKSYRPQNLIGFIFPLKPISFAPKGRKRREGVFLFSKTFEEGLLRKQ